MDGLLNLESGDLGFHPGIGINSEILVKLLDLFGHQLICEFSLAKIDVSLISLSLHSGYSVVFIVYGDFNTDQYHRGVISRCFLRRLILQVCPALCLRMATESGSKVSCVYK